MAIFSTGRADRPFWRIAFLWTGALAILIATTPFFLLLVEHMPVTALMPREERAPMFLPGITVDGTSGAVHRPVVTSVESSSPAARSGVRVGDRIVGLNGRPVHSMTDLRRLGGAWAAIARPGDKSAAPVIEVDFLRNHRHYRIRLNAR